MFRKKIFSGRVEVFNALCEKDRIKTEALKKRGRAWPAWLRVHFLRNSELNKNTGA